MCIVSCAESFPCAQLCRCMDHATHTCCWLGGKAQLYNTVLLPVAHNVVYSSDLHDFSMCSSMCSSVGMLSACAAALA